MINQNKLTIRDRPFQAIIKGTKTVEIRANKIESNVNYRLLAIGDAILFTNEETNEVIKCAITRKVHYKSVRELLINEGTSTTLSSTNCIEKGIKSIESIGNYKKTISKRGVFAIEIALK